MDTATESMPLLTRENMGWLVSQLSSNQPQAPWVLGPAHDAIVQGDEAIHEVTYDLARDSHARYHAALWRSKYSNMMLSTLVKREQSGGTPQGFYAREWQESAGVVVRCILYSVKAKLVGETTFPIPAKRFTQAMLRCRKESQTETIQEASSDIEDAAWDKRRLKILAAVRAFGESTDANY